MPQSEFPHRIEQALARAHPAWQRHLRAGLRAMAVQQPDYLEGLSRSAYLPTENRLFAAFSEPPETVRYVLMGEGPYPRPQSATGVCFMDGAVQSLWQDGVGLAKPVNRATSLRNFIKMLLVADGALNGDCTSGTALQPIASSACRPGSGWIADAAELQANLIRHGFLLLNASLVFRSDVAPALDAKAWLPFLRSVLQALAAEQHKAGAQQIQLVLWGKIAEKVLVLPEAAEFGKLVSEHPYNLSFIQNNSVQDFFRPFHLLKKSP